MPVANNPRAGGALDPAGDYAITGQWQYQQPPSATQNQQTGTTFAPNQHVGGYYVLANASAMAVTLQAPAAVLDDGNVVEFTSDSAAAHVITITNLDSGSDAVASATFNPYKGASLTLRAYNGRWKVIAANGVTFA